MGSALTSLGLLFGCAATQQDVAAAGAHAVPAQQYVIGPGDHLGIFVYDEPQLSEADLPVRPDGLISTPLVADVDAAGKTSSELADILTKRLAVYVRDPKVTVLLKGFVGESSQQIRIVGAAAEPLAIPYSTGLTVLDVMIQTRGLTKFAAGNRAVIIRRGGPPGTAETRIRVHLSDLMKDGDMTQNLPMQPGDTLIIPQSWF